MARKRIDCRDMGKDSGCTLAIEGEERELMEAAIAHAEKTHGEHDSPELREAIRSHLHGEEERMHADPG